jgi:hypothetical protein
LVTLALLFLAMAKARALERSSARLDPLP